MVCAARLGAHAQRRHLCLRLRATPLRIDRQLRVVNPDLPSEAEVGGDPDLEDLSSDNPYLRSPTPTLITDVLDARLRSESTGRLLEDKGLSTDYGVGRGVSGNGFVVEVTGIGESSDESLATTEALGNILVEDLRELQKVNGADDQFLFTALAISTPETATEQFSSRLRSVISVLIAGGILALGVASLGRWSTLRTRRRAAEARVDSQQPNDVEPRGRHAERASDAGAATQVFHR